MHFPKASLNPENSCAISKSLPSLILLIILISPKNNGPETMMEAMTLIAERKAKKSAEKEIPVPIPLIAAKIAE